MWQGCRDSHPTDGPRQTGARPCAGALAMAKTPPQGRLEGAARQESHLPMVGSRNPSSDHYKIITPHHHEYVNLKNHPKLAKSERRPRRSLGEDGMSTLK